MRRDMTRRFSGRPPPNFRWLWRSYASLRTENQPNALSDSGLGDAIRGLTASSSVPVRLLTLPAIRLDPAVEATAYYVVAEALANAQKHAGSSTIRVSVRLEREVLTVEIGDDGGGGADERAGTGLLGLRRRIEAAGGTFELDSPPGGGTRLAAALPTRNATAG